MLFSEIPHLGALQLQLQLVRNEGDELRIGGLSFCIGYGIQIKNNQLVITKSFAKNGYCFGIPEYEMLQTVRRDYPEFKVVLREIKKNTNVDHYKGLNYEYIYFLV